MKNARVAMRLYVTDIPKEKIKYDEKWKKKYIDLVLMPSFKKSDNYTHVIGIAKEKGKEKEEKTILCGSGLVKYYGAQYDNKNSTDKDSLPYE